MTHKAGNPAPGHPRPRSAAAASALLQNPPEFPEAVRPSCPTEVRRAMRRPTTANLTDRNSNVSGLAEEPSGRCCTSGIGAFTKLGRLEHVRIQFVISDRYVERV